LLEALSLGLTVAGLHIAQAPSPNSTAVFTSIASETFFTMLQLAKWYFFPDGVLYTVCAWSVTEINKSNMIENRRISGER